MPSQAAVCPCCESVTGRLAFEKRGHAYYACSNCSVTFIYPRPQEEELRERYADYGERYYSRDGIKEYLLSPAKYLREIELLRQTTQIGRLLDVGCSVGGFVKAARELGYEAEGIDVSESSVRVGRAMGLPLRAGNFLQEEIQQRCGVVSMWATLEHLPNPNVFVRRARELLHPGGVLLASVPNYSGITQRLIGAKDRYVGGDHLNYWTASGFPEYLRRMGFEVVTARTFAFNPILLWQDWRHPDRSMECEDIAETQEFTAALKTSPLSYLHRFGERVLDLCALGDVVAVAALKPMHGEGTEAAEPHRKN